MVLTRAQHKAAVAQVASVQAQEEDIVMTDAEPDEGPDSRESSQWKGKKRDLRKEKLQGLSSKVVEVGTQGNDAPADLVNQRIWHCTEDSEMEGGSMSPWR